MIPCDLTGRVVQDATAVVTFRFHMKAQKGMQA